MIDMEAVKRHADEYFRILIYGQAFSGKTHFLKSLPRPMKVHDFDLKIEPLMGEKDIFVEQYNPQKPEDCEYEFARFRSNWGIDSKDKKWKTLVLEGLSGLDIISLRSYVKSGGKSVDTAPEIQHYGGQSNFYNILFKFLINGIIDKHVVVTAHEQTHLNEQKEQSFTPLITGVQMIPKLPAFFKEVYHLENRNGIRYLHYLKYKNYICGSTMLPQTPPGEIKDPTFQKILELAAKGK